MNHRIPCEIIQDLMPMYADGLTSETTDREIRSHLEECETCREMYERMRGSGSGWRERLREEHGRHRGDAPAKAHLRGADV